jgi:hypothetical protein
MNECINIYNMIKVFGKRKIKKKQRRLPPICKYADRFSCICIPKKCTKLNPLLQGIYTHQNTNYSSLNMHILQARALQFWA